MNDNNDFGKGIAILIGCTVFGIILFWKYILIFLIIMGLIAGIIYYLKNNSEEYKLKMARQKEIDEIDHEIKIREGYIKKTKLDGELDTSGLYNDVEAQKLRNEYEKEVLRQQQIQIQICNECKKMESELLKSQLDIITTLRDIDVMSNSSKYEKLKQELEYDNYKLMNERVRTELKSFQQDIELKKFVSTKEFELKFEELKLKIQEVQKQGDLMDKHFINRFG